MTGGVIVGAFPVGGMSGGSDGGGLPVLFAQLSRLHSMNIHDPVVGGSADGQRWSSVQRDAHLNEAIRRWIIQNALAGMVKESLGLNGNWLPLHSYLAESSQAMTNNTTNLGNFTGGVTVILGAYNASKSQPVKRLPDKPNKFTPQNTYLMPSPINQFWAIDGSQFRLYDGSTTNTDTVTIRYVKLHTSLASTAIGGNDLLVPSQFWGQILDLAKEIAELENGNESTFKSEYVQGEIERG